MNDSLIDRFRRFAVDRASDELAGALLVNQALDPKVDVVAARAKADALADGCPGGALPWAYLSELGFAGNRNNYADLTNSCMDQVLETRRGIPISLGVLLVHVARRLGCDAHGINFPGHFLARIDGALVDPFALDQVTEDDCLQRLGKDRAPATFEAASSTVIALRMLNNAKHQFAGMSRWDRVLDLVDCQLALRPDTARLLVEKGRAWEALGAPDIAEGIYQQALRAPDADEARATAEARLGQLRRDTATWH